MELPSVGDSEAAHSVGMAPFLEVLVKRLTAFVHVVSTNLARVLNAQSMQLVEPVRDGFTIPS